MEEKIQQILAYEQGGVWCHKALSLQALRSDQHRKYRSDVGQFPGCSSWKAQGETSIVVHLLFVKHRDLSEPCYSV